MVGYTRRAMGGGVYPQGHGWWAVSVGLWMLGCTSNDLERTLPSPPQAVTPENCLSFYRLRSGGALRLEKM